MTRADRDASQDCRELIVQNVSKVFLRPDGRSVPVFSGLDLRASCGQIVCLVGPSGCGKTTLLNIVSGLEPAGEGSISIATEHGQHRQWRTGYMFQRDRLMPWRTALENVLLATEITGRERTTAIVEAMRLFEQIGIAEFADSSPSEMSEGMRQRVALVRTLLLEPQLLLLDEPLSSIDHATRFRLQELLVEYVRQRRIAALWVSHDLEEAVAVADEVLIFGERPLGVIGRMRLDRGTSPIGPAAFRSTPNFTPSLEALTALLTSSPSEVLQPVQGDAR